MKRSWTAFARCLGNEKKMINLVHISRANLLSGRTNVYNLAKTCDSLNAVRDVRVRLVTTNRRSDTRVFFQRMAIQRPFEVVCLGATDTSSPYAGRQWYELLAFFSANVSLVFFLSLQVRKFDTLYFRDSTLAFAAWWAKVVLRKRVFFEIHSVLQRRSKQWLNEMAIRLSNGVVAISSGLKNYYQGMNSNIIVSLCSAAEDSWFDYSQNKERLRRQLKLPQDAFLLGYTGVVGANPNNDYYEIDDVIKSLVDLPERISLVIVGEINHNAEWLRQIAREFDVSGRVVVVPWQERSLIPNYLQAFDAILIPKRKKDFVGDSPAKMFPALAARRPIIAGRAECIEEVLTHNLDALIVRENNPSGWKEAILAIYHDSKLGEHLASNALITKDKYTWSKRGANIADFVRRSTL